MIHTSTHLFCHLRSAMGGYRYFFNGQEADDEVYGEGGFQNYGFRMYDTRLARFWGVDPLTKDYPMLSTFQFASCSPILLVDVEGLEGIENTTGYTSDGVPFYYFNARQSTYVEPIILPKAELKRPLLQVTKQHTPYQGEIRPARSEYEKEWEFSASSFANYIRNDRVLQSVSLSGFIATSYLFGGCVASDVLPYAVQGGEGLFSLGLKIYNNPWGKLSIGAGTGWVAYKQDWSPDINIPDPIIGMSSQYFQFLFSTLSKNDYLFDLKQKKGTNTYEKLPNNNAKSTQTSSKSQENK